MLSTSRGSGRPILRRGYLSRMPRLSMTSGTTRSRLSVAASSLASARSISPRTSLWTLACPDPMPPACASVVLVCPSTAFEICRSKYSAWLRHRSLGAVPPLRSMNSTDIVSGKAAAASVPS